MMVRRISRPSTSPFSLWEQGYLAGLRDAGMSVHDIQAETGVSKRLISKYMSGDLATPLPHPIESKQEEDDAILNAATKKPHISLAEINENIIPDHLLTTGTLKRHFKEKDMHKWLAAIHPELEEKDTTR
ncbi:hypothetical protein L873DRAFT_1787174 [Choiromyces venosus 120613-1]|uniref:Uncharacterized protein n=1 Tax=Choiromyces venosus 120613-1 TaxID=1336337 RepID=A0A3N4K2H5_9PEZI|nr:hypothetical protein L873DRAFT_1787174 [Choiromyces venosus 120613-1]